LLPSITAESNPWPCREFREFRRELPADIERLLAQASTAARWGTAIGSILRRPSTLKDLLRLRHRAIEASDRLAKFLAEIIRRPAE
jgi:hypothetical protein